MFTKINFDPPVTTTLVDLLRANASAMGDKLAFRLVRDGDGDDVSITYGALDHRAKAIGGALQSLLSDELSIIRPTDPVGLEDPATTCALLLFPPGLGFIEAFFGCLYAGVVAVPVAPPTRNRGTSSLKAILQASDPALILTTTEHRERAKQCYAHLPELLGRRWIATDQVADASENQWHDPQVDGRQTAFLQFTSGSTSSPKGVMLSHENLLHNAAIIKHAFGNTSEGRGVSWLPLYHDMGLIGGVVQPIYCGGMCTLLAPVAFLQRPAVWLETISRTRATVSGGPDFAYDLCVRRIPPRERRALDLSSWEVAFTGAERVRPNTIERFVGAFAPSGFRREAFFPCYGLAEATLMVSGGPRQTAPTIVRVHAGALAGNRVEPCAADDTAWRAFVGCGQDLPGQEIVIADPRTRLQCAPAEVGEIWVQGPSVAGGYYRQPAATQTAFAGYLRDTGEGPFLRTGDLGFLREGQLFVTGRLKDVIIIRGRNYYPEDIEHSVDGAHTAFRAGHCAAFSIELEDRERLVVAQEIEPRTRDLDVDAIVQTVRRRVAAEHEIEIYGIVLAKAGAIPKTSSGKTRRSACRKRYLNGQLKAVAEWKAHIERALDETEDAPIVPCPEPASAEVIEGWLIEWIAARSGVPRARVGVATPFLEFGMSSMDAMEVAGELERRLGRRLSPTAVYNYPNIAALARWLADPPPNGDQSARFYRTRVSRGEPHPERLIDDVRNMTEDEIEAFIRQEMAKQ